VELRRRIARHDEGRTPVSSFFDKAKDLAREHGDKIDEALDKVGDVVDEKTGGKHREKIDKAIGEAKKHTGDGTSRP
jgi:Flp pilus assembly protein TadB